MSPDPNRGARLRIPGTSVIIAANVPFPGHCHEPLPPCDKLANRSHRSLILPGGDQQTAALKVEWTDQLQEGRKNLQDEMMENGSMERQIEQLAR